MANNKTRLDDFKFDDLGIDGLESEKPARKVKRDRKPIERISTSFASGAKEAFTSPTVIRDFASNALPRGYGSIIQGGYDTYHGGVELYNIASQELRPALPAIRRATGRVLPKVKSFLPKPLADKIEEFAKKNDVAYRGPSQEEFDNAEISGTLGEIFKLQMEANAEEQANNRTERLIRDNMRDQQSRSSIMRLDAIRSGIDRMVSYQDQITAKYQRKSLELQYRQYFTLRDILKHQVRIGERDEMYQQALLHNTALSEQDKARAALKAGGSIRERLLNSFQQQASDYVRNFKRDFQNNIRNAFRSALSGVASGIQMGDEAAEQMRQTREMMEDFGEEPEGMLEQGSKAAGGFFAENIGRLVGGRVRRIWNPKGRFSQSGAKVARTMINLPEIINEWGLQDDGDMTLAGMAKQALRNLVPRGGLNTRFGSSPILTADQPATFDQVTRRSIIEVIPGYLSRIHHELAIMRTGDEKMDRITYNMDRGTFTSLDKATQDARARLFNPAMVMNAQNQLNRFVDQLDPEGKLSSDARTALLKQIMLDSSNMKHFKKERYTSFDELTPELTGAQKEEVAALLENKFRLENGEQDHISLLNLQDQFNNLRNQLFDPRSAMEVYGNIGQEELLGRIGLLRQKGFGQHVDYEQVREMILSAKNPDTPKPEEPAPTFGQKVRNKLNEKFDQTVDSIEDIFVKGAAHPAVTAAKIRANHYRDQVTGKPIQSFADIHGPVVDRDGNVVLTEADVRAGLVDAYGRPIPDLSDRVRRTASRYRDRIVKGYRRIIKPRTEKIAAQVSSKIHDIYADGQASPAIQATKLQAGLYRDQATKAVLKTVDDIRGNVIDENGQVVLTTEQVLAGVRDGSGRVLRSLKKRMQQAKQQAPGIGRRLQQGFITLQTQATEQARNWRGRLHDIYIEGKSHPVIEANKLRLGEYYDQLSGNVIQSMDDIKGTVVDAYGNVVLSAEDIGNGLRDRVGKPLKRIESAIRSRIQMLHDTHLKEQAAVQADTATVDETVAAQPAAAVEFPEEWLKVNQDQLEVLHGIYQVLSTRNFGLSEGLTLAEGRKSWGQETLAKLGGLGMKGLRGLKWFGKLYGGYVKAIGKGIGGLFGGVGRTIGNITGLGTNLLKRPFDRFADIYVKGEKSPVLKAHKMRRGHYQDVNTKKIVKNIKDIKGPVIDLSDNGNEVLSQEQFDAGIYLKGQNGFIRYSLGALGGLAKTVVGGYAAVAKLPFQMLSAGAKLMSAGIKQMFNDQVDVYVMTDLKTPRLRAVLMKAKRYYSVKTGRFIKGFKDIDGPVKELSSADGKASAADREVLSEEEVKLICNSRGRPLATAAQKLIGIATNVAAGVGNYISGGVRMLGKVVGGTLGLAGDLFGGSLKRFGMWFNPKEYGAQSRRQTEILTSIYNLLDDRIPIPEKIREGSWQDQMRERVEKRNEAQAAAGRTADGKSAGILSTFASFLQGRRKDTEETGEEGDDGDTTVIAGGGGAAAKKGPKWWRNLKARGTKLGRAVSRSKVGRLAGKLGLGKVARFGGRALGMAAKVGMAAAGFVGLGSLGSAVGAVGGGLATAAGAIGTAAATVGSAALGILASPVVLGAAALAAVGAAAYFGYKYYQHRKDQPLRKLRLAQYGIDPTNYDHMDTILKLENMLKDKVSFGREGATINPRDVDPQELFKIFDLDGGWFGEPDDDELAKQQSMLRWLNVRFKPVFLTWMSVLHGIDPQQDLDDVDDGLKPEQKEKLLKAVRQTPGDTSDSTSPFEDADRIVSGTKIIDAAYKEAVEKIKGEVEKDKRSTGAKIADGAMSVAAHIVPGAALAKAMSEKPQSKTAEAKARARRFGVFGVMADEMEKNKLLAASPFGVLRAFGKSVIAVARGDYRTTNLQVGRAISALDGIRYRAYGLTTMDRDRVNALLNLERETFANFQYDTAGAATFTSSAQVMFKLFGDRFGMTVDREADEERWVAWFNHRFLPVALAFASAVRRYNKTAEPQDAEKVLSAEQLVEVGNAVVGAKLGGVMGVSVWTFSASPWDDEGLNTDSKSTFAGLLVLKGAVKKQVLTEPKVDGKAAQVKKKAAELDRQVNDQAKAGSFTSKIADWMSNIGNRAKQAVSSVWEGAKSLGAQVTGATVAADAAAANAVGVAWDGKPFGSSVEHPGHGTGGDINQIPMPKGDGKWSAVKDTILAAAKMVGVSPQLMATMANIESGFRTSVKAGTSSATGLYQFVSGTWRNMLKRYASKYGISPDASPTDPRANALMGAEFLKENAAHLRRQLGREPTDTELYTAHFMGAGGASKLLKALAANPNANAAQLFPKAASANQPIFYQNGAPRSIAGVMSELDRRVKARRIDVATGASVPTNNVAPQAPEVGGHTTTTANGATGGLQSYAGATPAANEPSFENVNSASTTVADVPKPKPVRMAPPAPSIMHKAGVQAAAVLMDSNASDHVIEQQRVAATQRARIDDIRSREAAAEANRQLATMVNIMSEQLTTQRGMSSKLDTVVKLLGNIDGKAGTTAETKAAVASSETPSKPASIRGARPLESTPATPPVNIRRTQRAVGT